MGYRFGLFGDDNARGLAAYRALYRDYEAGSGSNVFKWDMTLHGPRPASAIDICPAGNGSTGKVGRDAMSGRVPALPDSIVTVAGVLVLSSVVLITTTPVCGAASPPSSENAPTFVGSAACGGCHQSEMAAWRGSHHDLAMQEATAETVLGDFDDASFTHGDVTSRFFRRDGKFLVTTDGPDGRLEDFEIRYTFGVYPLQQYLIAFPDGRVQALGIAWDTRPEGQGGQRWFHLYPDQELETGDPLHWTGIDQR